MIIIEKPYASDNFIQSVVKNEWVVLQNEAIEMAGIEEGALDTITPELAQKYYENEEYPRIYSNSEKGVNWVMQNLPKSALTNYIKFFKNKGLFRDILKEIYPNYNYRILTFEDLKNTNLEDLKFPLVIKPTVGYLNAGVNIVQNDAEWKSSLFALENEIKILSKDYCANIINFENFIVEDYIIGEEYAIDAYYDNSGNPVILSIYQHPFVNSKDIKDRVYMTSVGIMIKYMSRFAFLLKQIGDKAGVKNLPIHAEFRVTPENEIIPIEMNPLRYAGWCACDTAKYAWGIDVYECFMKQKRPDWNTILSESNRGVYYFSMAEVPSGLEVKKIKSFDLERYLSNFSNVLEVRNINYKVNPLFAMVIAKTDSPNEIKNILTLNISNYIDFN